MTRFGISRIIGVVARVRLVMRDTPQTCHLSPDCGDAIQEDSEKPVTYSPVPQVFPGNGEHPEGPSQRPGVSPAKVEGSAGSPSQSLDTLRLFQVEVTNLGQLSADIPFLTRRADQREHPCSRIDVVNNASDVVRRCRTGGNIARE